MSPIFDSNLISLEPDEKLEDVCRYHSYLLSNGFMKVHDRIGLPKCTFEASKEGRCKEMFVDAWSRELVQSNMDTVGDVDE